MLSLKDRLLSVEEDFLASMLNGDKAMSAFDQRWQTLLDDIDHAMETEAATNSINHDIPALAFAVASRVATLADTSVALFTTCDTISSDLYKRRKVSSNPLSFSPSSHADRYFFAFVGTSVKIHSTATGEVLSTLSATHPYQNKPELATSGWEPLPSDQITSAIVKQSCTSARRTSADVRPAISYACRAASWAAGMRVKSSRS